MSWHLSLHLHKLQFSKRNCIENFWIISKWLPSLLASQVLTTWATLNINCYLFSSGKLQKALGHHFLPSFFLHFLYWQMSEGKNRCKNEAHVSIVSPVTWSYKSWLPWWFSGPLHMLFSPLTIYPHPVYLFSNHSSFRYYLNHCFYREALFYILGWVKQTLSYSLSRASHLPLLSDSYHWYSFMLISVIIGLNYLLLYHKLSVGIYYVWSTFYLQWLISAWYIRNAQ